MQHGKQMVVITCCDRLLTLCAMPVSGLQAGRVRLNRSSRPKSLMHSIEGHTDLVGITHRCKWNLHFFEHLLQRVERIGSHRQHH